MHLYKRFAFIFPNPDPAFLVKAVPDQDCTSLLLTEKVYIFYGLLGGRPGRIRIRVALCHQTFKKWWKIVNYEKEKSFLSVSGFHCAPTRHMNTVVLKRNFCLSVYVYWGPVIWGPVTRGWPESSAQPQVSWCSAELLMYVFGRLS